MTAETEGNRRVEGLISFLGDCFQSVDLVTGCDLRMHLPPMFPNPHPIEHHSLGRVVRRMLQISSPQKQKKKERSRAPDDVLWRKRTLPLELSLNSGSHLRGWQSV